MTEKWFKEFVQKTLGDLDELSRWYATCKFEICQQYWEDLRTLIRHNKPVGYEFVEEKPNLSQAVEHFCGWSRAVVVSGTPTIAYVGFAYYGGRRLPGGWPFMNNSCYTGIRMWLPDARQFLNTAHQLVPESEDRDEDWLLWQWWGPLASADVEGLYERLTGSERGVGQQEIVEQLIQWKQHLEQVLAQLHPPT